MTNPALSPEPGPGGACRVCGTVLDSARHCGHCGATYGESNRCPHCRSVTDVEPSEPLGFRCRVCGGPRVPTDDAAVVRTGREQPLLARAQRAQRRSSAFRVGAGFVAAFAVLSALVSLAVFVIGSPGLVGTLGMLVMLAVPFALSLVALRRSNAERREREQALDEAWLLVASDVLASRPEVTAPELAKVLRSSEARAETLLARLNVNDFVHARVTDLGEVAYSTRTPERVRLTEPSGLAAQTLLAEPDELPAAETAHKRQS